MKILWPADESNTIQHLGQLLDPEYAIRLEPFEDGRSAPKAKGTSWRRLYAQMLSVGPYAQTLMQGDQSTLEQLAVLYQEGTETLTQVWVHRPPEFVNQDWRLGSERERMKVMGLTPNQFNGFEKFLFNACLPMNLARSCAQWFNERLPGDSNHDLKKQTSAGEIVKFWGYMGAIALQPGTPVDHMWRSKPYVGDIGPPPNMGRHGMHKNRFKKLRSLHRFFYAKDEEGLSPTNPFRYCSAIVDHFNEHRVKRFIPSWLLVIDESMSAFLGAEGVIDGVGANPDPIPHRDFIERKPEPLGKELKVLADGMSGVTLRMEMQLGCELHALQEYFQEYGHTTAVQLRLLKPYFPKSNDRASTVLRALYGDSWFMGVDSAEAIHWEVCMPLDAAFMGVACLIVERIH